MMRSLSRSDRSADVNFVLGSHSQWILIATFYLWNPAHKGSSYQRVSVFLCWSPIMSSPNITFPLNTTLAANITKKPCVLPGSYGEGFVNGDYFLNSALAYLLLQLLIITSASRALGKPYLLVAPLNPKFATPTESIYSLYLFHFIL
jgi:hypothetical protein